MTTWTAFASFLPSFPPSLWQAQDPWISLSPIMVLPGCPGNPWYFTGFAVSSMGRNDRTEASVLQAKADSQVPWLLMFP